MLTHENTSAFCEKKKHFIGFSFVSMDIKLRVVFLRENTRLKSLSVLYRILLLLIRKFKNVPSISKPAQVPLGKAW